MRRICKQFSSPSTTHRSCQADCTLPIKYTFLRFFDKYSENRSTVVFDKYRSSTPNRYNKISIISLLSLGRHFLSRHLIASRTVLMQLVKQSIFSRIFPTHFFQFSLSDKSNVVTYIAANFIKRLRYFEPIGRIL